MLYVAWPSRTATHAEIYRVLDLSGMCTSIRESKRYLQAGLVFLNNEVVLSLKDTVEIGKIFHLSLKLPKHAPINNLIFLTKATFGKPRNVGPLTIHRKA